MSLIGIILRWGFLIWELFFFIYCGLFVLILVVFVVFFFWYFSLRFSQISPLAFFRWLTATSDRNAESCNRIPSNYSLPWLLSIAPRFWPSKTLAGLGRIWNRYFLTMLTRWFLKIIFAIFLNYFLRFFKIIFKQVFLVHLLGHS